MSLNPFHRASLSDNLPSDDETPDIGYINEVVKRLSHFINEEGVSSVFICEKQGDIQYFDVPSKMLNNPDEKEQLSSMIKSIVDTWKPDSHCFISEAWLYRIENCDSPEEAQKIMSDFKKGIPSDKIKKDEVVNFILAKMMPAGVERWQGSIPFTRDSSNKINSFGNIKWFRQKNNSKFEGRLVV